jgi:hypothetical protein
MILDLRFAVCDLAGWSAGPSLKARALSLTPCLSGVRQPSKAQNRFSGFEWLPKTAEAVWAINHYWSAPLKQGFNERGHLEDFLPHRSQWWTRA